MDEIRRYLLSVIATALICGLLPDLLRDGGTKTLVKTACGLVLTVTVFSPLKNVSPGLPDDFPSFRDSASFAAADGESLAKDAMLGVIKSKAETYILDKAAQWDADIRVDLELDGTFPYVPVAARISGTYSPMAQTEIEALLATQFEIPKEAQTWTP